jgi:iron complex transport system substrate-binding protein
MRIASLAPSVTTMLQELGVADSIVACTHFCPLPEVQRQRKAIGSFSVLNIDRLQAAQPDLVITATTVQASGQARLAHAGFRVLHLDPRRLIDVADSYHFLGHAVNMEKRAQKLAQEFLEAHAALKATVPLAAKPKVYMEEWHEPPYVAGSWVPDMVALAGGEAVLSESGLPSRSITLQELTAANPDLIIQHICLAPTRDWTHHRQQLVRALRRRPGWQELNAVRTDAVYPLDDRFINSPTKNLLVGVRKLREILHHHNANVNTQGAVDKLVTVTTRNKTVSAPPRER